MQFDEFIEMVRNRARLDSLEDAVKATRAVLETLAERLTLQEVKNLASQLPSEIAYYLRQRSAFFQRFGLDEFFERVGQGEPADLTDATYHTRVVISVLQSAVTRGLIDHVRSQLPGEFSPLFDSGSQGELKKAA